ncbi:hypothetical protein TCAL_04987 [Tigriopus californicus]|uniref:Peptidase M14 domain-containing protein n=1 Tax=Tigriopus californicus TaxID=6832 RepID=A0A553PBA1_TIGCA|nr:carboxypeptidase B-like [Tigriopus californicus]TRY74919.1 hypothetical protein TCAL_04987 [Tigriopus californicus]
MMKFVGILALAALAISNVWAMDYSGYKVLRTQALNKTAAGLLRNLQAENSHYDFWKDANTGMNAEIMVSPGHLSSLQNYLKGQAIQYSLKVEDVQELIAKTSQREPLASKRGPSSPKYNLDWNDYYDYDIIVEFMEELANDYEFVNVVSIGKSYEGQDMKVIQITKAGDGAPNVWIEAGIHAREWIAPAVATYVIRELIENYDDHPEYLDSLNFHFLPCANPDGYQFSRNEQRLWRKTRSDTGSSLGCKGVDPNRNFDYAFGESGVSNDKCSDIYPGPEAFSEIETRNIRDYTSSLSPTPVIAKALHSAAELWLYPYGYALDTYPENVDEIRALGEECVEALNAVNGMNFVNQHSAGLYPAAGDANDWYTGVLKARFTYTVELRDQGYGFLLPPEQIIDSSVEIWAAYEVLFSKAIEVSK